MSASQPLHGGVVARRGPDGWRGVLIQGPSGVGKSDLALRLMGQGWRLVADDWVHLWRSGDHLYATAPAPIAGRMEVRGLGIVAAPVRAVARVRLVVTCAWDPVERLPEREDWTCQGVAIPRLRLDPRPASAGQVVATALDSL